VKKIEAIIRPEKLTAVREALREIGVSGGTVTEVKGHGAQRGVVEQWRGATYTVDLISKMKLETVVNDDLLEGVLAAIHETACTGEIGDGKVFVSEITDAMRVRTGERGKAAV